MPPDSAWIETQIGVLKSLNVLAYVVKQLRLADDPQFIRAGTWPLDRWPLDRLLARLGLGRHRAQNRSGARWCGNCCSEQRT